jgi:hypothetical protein
VLAVLVVGDESGCVAAVELLVDDGVEVGVDDGVDAALRVSLDVEEVAPVDCEVCAVGCWVCVVGCWSVDVLLVVPVALREPEVEPAAEPLSEFEELVELALGSVFVVAGVVALPKLVLSLVFVLLALTLGEAVLACVD